MNSQQSNSTSPKNARPTNKSPSNNSSSNSVSSSSMVDEAPSVITAKIDEAKGVYNEVASKFDDEARSIVDSAEKMKKSLLATGEQLIDESMSFVKKYPTQIAFCAMAVGFVVNFMNKKPTANTSTKAAK